MFTIIKSLFLIALFAFFMSSALIIHRTSLTDFLTHEGVPSLFKNVNTESEEFQKLAQEELNKINVGAGIPSAKPKSNSAKPPSSTAQTSQTKPKSSTQNKNNTGVSPSAGSGKQTAKSANHSQVS